MLHDSKYKFVSWNSPASLNSTCVSNGQFPAFIFSRKQFSQLMTLLLYHRGGSLQIFISLFREKPHQTRVKQGRFSQRDTWSVHTSANLIFHFSNKNGKGTHYLFLLYLHILKYQKKQKKENGHENRSFFVFLILKLNSKIQKIL